MFRECEYLCTHTKWHENIHCPDRITTIQRNRLKINVFSLVVLFFCRRIADKHKIRRFTTPDSASLNLNLFYEKKSFQSRAKLQHFSRSYKYS